jgi:hypothetical protein
MFWSLTGFSDGGFWMAMMSCKVIATALVFCLSVAVGSAAEGPFAISVSGNFKRMLHSGDASGKIALASLLRSAETYGIGALADLRGEIMLWEGKVLITPGESAAGAAQPPGAGDQAALLVTARVREWERITVPDDMPQKAFERWVTDTARARGIDTDRPFPFLVMGAISDYAWHVVTGAGQGRGGGAHGQGHAAIRLFSGAETKGKLVGFYSGEALEGVISHPGERFHVHYAGDDLKISGHLDSFGVRQGAALLLPRP